MVLLHFLHRSVCPNTLVKHGIVKQYLQYYSFSDDVLICFNPISGVYAFGFLFMLPQLFVNYKVGYCFISTELY